MQRLVKSVRVECYPERVVLGIPVPPSKPFGHSFGVAIPTALTDFSTARDWVPSFLSPLYLCYAHYAPT